MCTEASGQSQVPVCVTFVTGSLGEPGAQHFSSVAWPLSPWDPFASDFQHLSYMQATETGFDRSSCLLSSPLLFASIFEVVCSRGWSRICSIAEGGLEQLIL